MNLANANGMRSLATYRGSPLTPLSPLGNSGLMELLRGVTGILYIKVPKK